MDRQKQQQQPLFLPGLTVQKADPLSVFEIGDYIGRGTYGVVRRARMKTSGRICAVKIMNDGQDIVEELRAEVRVLTQFVDHPNLPRFYGLYLDRSSPQQTIWLAMELCEGGSVASLSKYHAANALTVPEPVVAHIASSALIALVFLHSNCIIHRDVKCANILLTKDGRVLLSDFGVSAHLKDIGEKRSTAIGSPFWMSPEVIACENQADYRYDNRCDVWSLGISVIELCEGKPPLADLPPIKALFRIPSDPPPTLRRPERHSSLLRDFIAKCLVKDYEIRPAAAELRSHLFLASLGGAATSGEDPVAMLRRLISDKAAWEAGGMMTAADPAASAASPAAQRGAGGGRKSRRLLAQTRWDDLAQLSHLTEDGILAQLAQRYSSDMVYTYLGDILLAINPFKQLSIYTDAIAERYRDAAKADNSPHVFAVADECLQRLRQSAGSRGQCVVISGESGAGKTCTADLLLRQLVRLSTTEQPALMERLLQVNPLLEAFGNAATVLNENSSRFGKYLELLVSPTGCIRGARLAHFLLEKARVVYQSKGERNFHIFYHLAHGESHEHAALLAKQTDFRYLHATFAPDSGRAAVHRAHLSAVRRGFLDLGFAESEVSSVFRLLSGILFLGNLRFNDHVERSNADIATDSSKVANPDAAAAAANLLGVSPVDLADALTKSSLVARGESIQKFHSPADARASRDAMAKAVYNKLFSWIVQRTNDLLAPAGSSSSTSSIGILDIFGFENLSFNSFEQLCINTANEQLHYFFIQHVFNWEKHELEQEGISISVQVYDNKPVLDLLLGRPYGLLALLDEECAFPKATDLTLTEKLHKHAAERFPRLYQPPKAATDPAFTVRHYAGQVTYSTKGFLSKNKDRLPVEIAALLRGSDLALLRSLFANNAAGATAGSSAAVSMGRPGSSGSTLVTPLSSAGLHKLSSGGSGVAGSRITGQTLAAYFRASLHDLLNRLLAAQPHFVRCLRPNREGRPDRIEPDKVLEQLRYTGVLETVEIRRQGYSHRLSFREFLADYGPLVLGFSPVSRGASAGQAAMDLCRTVLKKLGLTGWLVGRHKVFLKYHHVEMLIRRRAHLLSAVTKCQAAVRRWLAVRQLRRLRWSLFAARRVIQVWRAKVELRRRRRLVLRLQSLARGHLARQRYRKLKRDRVFKKQTAALPLPVQPPIMMKPTQLQQQQQQLSPRYSNNGNVTNGLLTAPLRLISPELSAYYARIGAHQFETGPPPSSMAQSAIAMASSQQQQQQQQQQQLGHYQGGRHVHPQQPLVSAAPFYPPQQQQRQPQHQQQQQPPVRHQNPSGGSRIAPVSNPQHLAYYDRVSEQARQNEIRAEIQRILLASEAGRIIYDNIHRNVAAPAWDSPYRKFQHDLKITSSRNLAAQLINSQQSPQQQQQQQQQVAVRAPYSGFVRHEVDTYYL